MTFNFLSLDGLTRRLMLEEFDLDVANGKVYLSPRLSEAGRRDYELLLRGAIDRGDEARFADALRAGGMLKPYESAAGKPKRVPVNAADVMAEAELNRFYCRAICRRAIEDGVAGVMIYRAKQVANPRPDSEAKIGTIVNPATLLADLRISHGLERSLGLPVPNSGLSVRLP